MLAQLLACLLLSHTHLSVYKSYLDSDTKSKQTKSNIQSLVDIKGNSMSSCSILTNDKQF